MTVNDDDVTDGDESGSQIELKKMCSEVPILTTQ